MKRICLTVVIFAVLSSITYGQANEAGSAAAAQALEKYRQQQAEAARAWKDSKKLTVLDKVPGAPRDQGYCLSVPDLKSDSVGYLEYWQFEVLQVAGPNDLLITMRNPKIPPLWLTGHSTKGLVDGDKVRLVGLIEVDGTKAYTTVAGARKTVRVVRLVSQKRVAELAARAEAKAWQERWKKDSRTWTDISGKFKIVAIYDGYLGEGKVRLLKEDKSEVVIPLSKLSKLDIKKAIALRRAAEDKKKRELGKRKK